ncbi:hypothetical protein MmTuc01_0554 [Methanosarcina mazei Tuc01]|uniref:Uncharacterized protein n=1 Tax=Methanosarcina mazei Tuc01 TaxID=1236903 RepID=M1QG64_METMZ|nr:hypothetical protein MmTuc01_0554 [Methanosarcina mazei Tuc01]
MRKSLLWAYIKISSLSFSTGLNTLFLISFYKPDLESICSFPCGTEGQVR